MRWDDFRRSDNVEDRRGESGGGGGGFGMPVGRGGLGIGVDVVALRLLASFADLQIVVMTARNRHAQHVLAHAEAASGGRVQKFRVK